MSTPPPPEVEAEVVPDGPRPVQQHRRWSLRARLIALVLAVAAIALAAVDILLPMNLRSSLLQNRDVSLQNTVSTLPRPFTIEKLQQLGLDETFKGEIGLSQVSPDGTATIVLPAVSDSNASPVFPADPVTGQQFTVQDSRRPNIEYRAYAVAISVSTTGAPAGYLVAWVSLADVETAIGQLIFTELLITVGLLILLGATASVIIRRELRPLEAMATAADDIAGGDLDRRVHPGEAGTEVGRLGFAFNGMLDGISQLIAERERTELRMRQFLADASHELRTPVAAVRGYTDLYKAGALPDEAAVGRAMDRMGFESVRMGSLVGDLLTLIQADGEKGEQHEPVDLSVVLTGVVDDAAVIDRTRTWRLVGIDNRGTAIVAGDRLRLHQLFANLLANIRTHTAPGTTATIVMGTTASEITVAVVDDGPGVGQADLPRLFDRFYRVDASRSREKGGTGLGLSIVAAVVRTHHGRIVASHTPGGGLTTTIVLPRLSPRPGADATGPMAAGSAGSSDATTVTGPTAGGIPAAPAGGPVLTKKPRVAGGDGEKPPAAATSPDAAAPVPTVPGGPAPRVGG